MSTSIRPVGDTSAVTVANGLVHIQDLVEADPIVVSTLEAADDPEFSTHTLLHIGARSVQLASTDLDIQVVEKRFDSMTGVFGTTVELAVNTISSAADQLVNEETGLCI